MTAKTKILMFAMDACEPDIARRLAASGEMPNLARLLAESATATSRNPYAMFPGTLWTSFYTARSAARTGFHCWEEVTLDYQRRLTSPLEVRGTPFWETLSDAGKRVCVIDVPHSRAATPLNGVQVCEYAVHDRHFGFHTQPPHLAKELDAQFGLHPILGVDAYSTKEWSPDDYVLREGQHRTRDENRALLTGLLDGIDHKTRVSLHLLDQGGWDLFLTVFGESHSVGHQMWHLHDPKHRWHDAELAAELGSPIEAVYKRFDRALGEHLARVDAGTTAFVLLSHGMGPRYEANHLLHEILRLLDRAEDRGVGGSSLMRTAKRAWAHAPGPVRNLVLPRMLPALRRRVATTPLPTATNWAEPEERVRQRFYVSPNNLVFGGIRINLVGREPNGRVHPGAEYDRVCARLAEDLLALVNLDTGAPVVRAVTRAEDHYDREENDTLPDLFIDWSHEAPVETVWSPRTGLVYGPDNHWRTGDHRPDGLLLASGPGITPGAALPDISSTDLGASLSARLGVELTGDVDGRPIPWIATAPTEAPV
ncbi:MAG TPA: alkaline phosphatase family protein [Actinophytocola sp.]|uniref:alkaline phosphatase family protein n=1 Tax=Actinophytocola sp. TaxID=1872138 RepID=UPI002DDCC0F4|nr:alkaline phosphatase family protein [Actinophytocola sp.]HEV2781745.1 alkaline phosphatase family protein [Actinophytocola sp.]